MNITKYLQIHKVQFPAIYHAGVDQLYTYFISTEVECESLFSQAGFIARFLLGKHQYQIL
jgi:hypothetical protein